MPHLHQTLNRMPTSSGNRQTYTFGFWWKNNSVGADSTVMPKETFHSAYHDAAESTSFGNSYGTDTPGGNVYFRSEHNNIATVSASVVLMLTYTSG